MEGDASSQTGKHSTMSVIDPDQEALMYLHNEESPGIMLVTGPLDGSNFVTWYRAMSMALKARGKFQFVDGRCKAPPEDSSDYWRWEKVDNMVLSWILSSLAEEIVPVFSHATTARELWVKIEQRFGTCTGHKLYQILRDIYNQKQGNLSILEYLNRLEMLWDEFDFYTSKMSAAELKDLNQLMQFLMGLREEFDDVRRHILLMNPMPNVDKAYSMVRTVESAMQCCGSISSGMNSCVMMTRSNNSGKKDLWKQRTVDKSRLYCDFCKKRGHLKESCFQLVGCPDRLKGSQKSKQADTKNRGSRSKGVAASIREVVKQESTKYSDHEKEMADPITTDHCCVSGFAMTGTFEILLSKLELYRFRLLHVEILILVLRII